MKLNKEGNWVPEIKAFYGFGKLDAKRKYEEYMKAKGSSADPDAYFGKTADTFIEDVFSKDPRYAPGTRLRYIGVYNTYIRTSTLAGMKISDVKAADVQKFYNELDCPAGTVQTIHKTMKKIFKYFESADLCRDITSAVYLPAKEKRTESGTPTWTKDELDRIFSEALDNHRLKLLLVLAYTTGARIGELLALTYDDIEDGVMTIDKQLARGMDADGKEAYVIREPKTDNAYREIPLTDEVMEVFREHESWHREEMKDKGYRTEHIFTTDTGNLYDRSNLRRALKRYYKKIGVEHKRFHAYRKTFCTDLCASGAPIQVVYKIMGHSSIDVTARYYVDVDMDQKRKALVNFVSQLKLNG